MYDREMIARAILSPFTSNLNHEIARQETVDGFKQGVRSIIVAPGQVDMILDVANTHGNGYTRTGMTVGYPYGGLSASYKNYLARYALDKGLDEIDVGVNITAVKSGNLAAARRELEDILRIADGKMNVIPLVWMVRIPLELADKILQMYVDIGITSIKTSPGIHFGDMKVEHIEYLARHYGHKLTIEVAGRVRSREKAEAMTLAGASYYHISQWRRIGGIGQDIQFNFETKEAAFGEYKDRM